jgi:hypothetical protein
MTELANVYFRNAAGEVHPVDRPAIEAIRAIRRYPWEYSLSRIFADVPEGVELAEGDGGGRGRVQGASVRAD